MHFRCKVMSMASWLGERRPRPDENPGKLVTCAVPERDCRRAASVSSPTLDPTFVSPDAKRQSKRACYDGDPQVSCCRLE
jgi:hypothetical protein